MFSPYYAWARRRGNADPRNHCALNVALYGPRGKRWAMTERGSASLRQQRSTLVIGPSAMAWDGNALSFQINEVTAPLPSRIVGTVRVIPRALVQHSAALDAAGRHHWTPIAPSARIEVQLDRPALCWSGDGYVDSNQADEPLQQNILCWNWSRSQMQHDSAVIYDVQQRNGSQTALALRFDRHGEVSEFAAPTPVKLPASGWHIARATRSEDGNAAVERTLEDTPFYARSVVSARLLGQATQSVHESLDLDRFSSPWVQAMLPFRMPRIG